MYANALLGAWPFIFEDNPVLRKLYNIYTNFTYTYFFVFIVTAYIKLIQLITAEKINLQEIFTNLAITLLYTVTILRVYALKTTRLMNIVREILDTEEKIHASEDESIINIYDSCSKQSRITNAIFLVNIFASKYIM